MSESYEELPKISTDRVVNRIYLYKDEIRIWNGKKLCCEHNRQRSRCKECEGGSICKHNRQRTSCKECGGSHICEHKRRRSRCKECEGGSICKHNRQRTSCKECGGSQICEHKIQRSQCKECEGGSICEHKRRRSRCKECEGGSICEHKKRKSICKTCDPNGYLTSIMRSRVRGALKRFSPTNPKNKRTMEYVGCDIDTLRTHLESQFTEGMSWENQGEWHIDHRRPCASFNLDNEEEQYMCFHYTNLQPLWGTENLEKNDSYDETTFEYEWKGIEIGWCTDED